MNAPSLWGRFLFGDNPMRVAIYARVSTQEQDTANQLPALREWCESNGHRITKQYLDIESGGHSDRPGFTELFQDAAKHRFDMVLVWALDRFSREGLIPVIFHLQRLETYGVKFKSFTEPHLSTDDELTRHITMAMYATVAKRERQRISERTLAGLARARASGKRLGRPPVGAELKAAVRGSQASYRVIAKALGISLGSVAKIKAETTNS
jgi:DNA invertase Pin-like site-specific DNA recombinase